MKWQFLGKICYAGEADVQMRKMLAKHKLHRVNALFIIEDYQREKSQNFMFLPVQT